MGRIFIIMLIAMSLIPSGDTAGKLLTSDHGVSPFFVAWSRFAIGAVLILPFATLQMRRLWRDTRIWLRAMLFAAGITSIQIALTTEPIATVFAAFFIGPALSYLLAVYFLREPFDKRRALLVFGGFMGVLIVVRPGMGGGIGMGWAVFAGICYGSFLTMSRGLSTVATPIELTISQLMICALLLLPVGAAQWPHMSAAVGALAVTSAVCSLAGNLILLYAYRIAPATTLAPLVYLQLLGAVLLGWSVFGALPDGPTWVGLCLIILAGAASGRLRALPEARRTDHA